MPPVLFSLFRFVWQPAITATEAMSMRSFFIVMMIRINLPLPQLRQRRLGDNRRAAPVKTLLVASSSVAVVIGAGLVCAAARSAGVRIVFAVRVATGHKTHHCNQYKELFHSYLFDFICRPFTFLLNQPALN